MRYDEASQFFIREMELKRKYRESNSSSSSEMKREVKRNHWLRKHFSITGLYYHLFRYGESLSKIGITITSFFILTTLFWLIYPSIIQADFNHQSNTTFIVNSNESIKNWKDLSTSLVNTTERTLSDMFQIRSQNLVPTKNVVFILLLFIRLVARKI
jgi:hypothetical protein